MTRNPIIAWIFLFVAIGAWAGFAYALQYVSAARTSYIDAKILSEEEATRGESASRLHTTVQSTEVERRALENLVNITILQAVQEIEKAGKDAGVSVTIGGATPASTPAKGLSAYSISLSAQGSFPAIMRTMSLFEVLPIPARVDQFDIGKGEKNWTLNARILVIIAAPK